MGLPGTFAHSSPCCLTMICSHLHAFHRPHSPRCLSLLCLLHLSIHATLHRVLSFFRLACRLLPSGASTLHPVIRIIQPARFHVYRHVLVCGVCMCVCVRFLLADVDCCLQPHRAGMGLPSTFAPVLPCCPTAACSHLYARVHCYLHVSSRVVYMYVQVYVRFLLPSVR